MNPNTNSNSEHNEPIWVACIGGGQLGRMMALEAPRLNIRMKFLDPLGMKSPVAMIVPNDCIVEGSLRDAAKIHELVSSSSRRPDVITMETEHINCDTLEELEKEGYNVQPCSRVMRIIQDKFLQKEHFSKNSIPVPSYVRCSNMHDIESAIATLGLPLMLKSRTGGYDGRGNAVLRTNDTNAIIDAVNQLVSTKISSVDGSLKQGLDFNLYAEGWVDFDYEIAVMVVRTAPPLRTANNATARNHNTMTKCYPVVTAIQQNSICRVVLSPARNMTADVRAAAERIAIQAIDSLGDGASGVFGVELFVTQASDGPVVQLNEIAPRPHNTGHYTQAACSVNQFENHIRAICGLQPGNTNMIVPYAAMINILGPSTSNNREDALAGINAVLTNWTYTTVHPSVHWYGKQECRPGRKMGHINLISQNVQDLDEALASLLAIENVPLSLLPPSQPELEQQQQREHLKLEAQNATVPDTLATESAATSTALTSTTKPIVGIIMGSQSDLPTMQDAVDILKQFNVPYEVDIVSAHRTPLKMMQYSQMASARGIQVIIAGAGGAAHLPGMVASLTPLPVIGVPIKTSTLSGVDSLYSIVQMPKGIPVATVAIGNAANAGLLAVRILGSRTSSSPLQDQMKQYQNDMSTMVHDSSTRLVELGSDEFLEQMSNKNKSVNV